MSPADAAAPASRPASPPRAPRSIGRQVAALVEGLHPAYFALVMATGVLAVGAHVAGLAVVARALFVTSLVGYGALVLLTVARAVGHRAALLRDLGSHARAPGFHTTIAATSVVGVELVSLAGLGAWGPAIWWASAALWAACMYAVLVALTVRPAKPALTAAIHGGWLLTVVSTQSLCVLGCAVGPSRLLPGETGSFLLLSLWLCGGMLYVWVSTLIVFRTLFLEYAPVDLMPPFWINMGAVAISTLAGAGLVGAAGGSAVLTAVLPFVKGLTVLFWSTATWWIPLIVLLGVWRHQVRGVRFAYDPLYWGLVFPLGMYSLATHHLGRVFDVPVLPGIARTFLVLGLVAWLVTFLGLAGRLLRGVLVALDAAGTPVGGPAGGPPSREPAGAASVAIDPRGAVAEARAGRGRALARVGLALAVAGLVVHAVPWGGSTPTAGPAAAGAPGAGSLLAAVLGGLGAAAWLLGSVRHHRAAIQADAVAAPAPAPREPEASHALAPAKPADR